MEAQASFDDLGERMLELEVRVTEQIVDEIKCFNKTTKQ